MIDGGINRSNECCPDSECDVCVSTEEATLPIDFSTAAAYLINLSNYWSSLPQTDGASVDYLYQSLTLTCGNDGFNHFTEVHLDGVTSVDINCSGSSTVLISYTSDTLAMENMGISLNGGVNGNRIIHHFTGATLTVSGINIIGSVFAPETDLFFPQGLITGQVIVGAFVGSSETVSTVSAALNDQCGNGSGNGHAIVTSATGSLVFDAAPQALFIQNDDGSASITGVARNGAGDGAFDVNVVLFGYTTNTPPNSPKEELKSSCYVQNGGSVDTNTWEYYETISGTMTGVAGTIYEGVEISITRMGPSAQVGNGASGKNVGDGLSFWFTFELVGHSPSFPESGTGDFNLDKEVVSTGSCPNGQINRNPFEGCCPTSRQLVCCQYENQGILNNFCAETQCVEIPQWDLLASSPVDDCSECTCPECNCPE